MKPKKMTKKEAKAIFAIDKIDPSENAIEIMNDPHAFFLPYLNKSPNNETTILIKFSIFNILKTIDSSEEIGEKISQYFVNNYTLNEWFEKIETLYYYIIDTADYIITHHNNTILDLYNNGKINKEAMEKVINSFANVQESLVKDKEMLNQQIKEIEEERGKKKDYGLM